MILGSTGSVGEQAIDVAEKFGVTVDAISAHKNVKRAEEQARHFGVKACAMSDPDAAKDLKERLKDTDIKVYAKTEGICEMIAETNGNGESGQVVENSIVGEAGLKPTLTTLNCKKKLALANKESLVVSGEAVMKAAKEKGIEIFPWIVSIALSFSVCARVRMRKLKISFSPRRAVRFSAIIKNNSRA